MSYTTVTLPHATQRVNPDAFCERVNGIWFVCLETSNDLMYSTSNGAIWAKADDSETTHTGVVTYVGWDGTRYVRIRGGLMAYSTDLQAWPEKASPFAVATWPARMAWNGTNWCTSGRTESGTQYVAYATDPTGTWTKQSTGLTTTPGTTVAWFGGTWFLGSTDAIESSTNLTSWSSLSWSVGGAINLYTYLIALFAFGRNEEGFLRQWLGSDASYGSDGWEYWSEDTVPSLYKDATDPLAGLGVLDGQFYFFGNAWGTFAHSLRFFSEREWVRQSLGPTYPTGSGYQLSAICFGGGEFIQFDHAVSGAVPFAASHSVLGSVTDNRYISFRISLDTAKSGTSVQIGEVKFMRNGVRVAQTGAAGSVGPAAGTEGDTFDNSLTTSATWNTGTSSTAYLYTYVLDGSVDGQRWYRLTTASMLRYPGNNSLSTAQGFWLSPAETGTDYAAMMTGVTLPVPPALTGGNYYLFESSKFHKSGGYWFAAFYDKDTYTTTRLYYSADFETWTYLGDAGANGWGGPWLVNGKWFKCTGALYVSDSLTGTWNAVSLPAGWTGVLKPVYVNGMYVIHRTSPSDDMIYSADLETWVTRSSSYAQPQEPLPIPSPDPYWIVSSGVSANKVVAATQSGATITYATKLASEETSTDNVSIRQNGAHSYAKRSVYAPDYEYELFYYSGGSFTVVPEIPNDSKVILGVTSSAG